MIKLSIDAITMFAGTLSGKLQESEMELAKAIAVQGILASGFDQNLIDMDLSEHDIDEEIRKRTEQLQAKKNILSELRESVQEFSFAFDTLKTFHAIEQKFKKAKPWTEYEKECMVELNDYYLKHKEWILPSYGSNSVVRYDEYIKLWDEKNGKR